MYIFISSIKLFNLFVCEYQFCILTDSSGDAGLYFPGLCSLVSLKDTNYALSLLSYLETLISLVFSILRRSILWIVAYEYKRICVGTFSVLVLLSAQIVELVLAFLFGLFLLAVLWGFIVGVQKLLTGDDGPESP